MWTEFSEKQIQVHVAPSITVDGRIVITGGRNIADEYFDYDHDYNFRDRDVLLLGGVATRVENTFEQFWNDPPQLLLRVQTSSER